MTDCVCAREVQQALRTRAAIDRPLESVAGQVLILAHRELQHAGGDMPTIEAIWREWTYRGEGQ